MTLEQFLRQKRMLTKFKIASRKYNGTEGTKEYLYSEEEGLIGHALSRMPLEEYINNWSDLSREYNKIVASNEVGSAAQIAVIAVIVGAAGVIAAIIYLLTHIN